MTLSSGKEGFLLDAYMHQFFKVHIDSILKESQITKVLKENTSVLELIDGLPLNSNLQVALENTKKV